MQMTSRPMVLPSLAVLLAGVLWGLFWIPMRWLAAAGFAGAWATLALYVVATAALLPGAVLRWRRLAAAGSELWVTALFTASGFALYATALLMAEVARVILLFYATPVWSTLMARFILGEPITGNRLVALVLGLAGLSVVLGVEDGLPVPRSTGDWLALLSGMGWAYGSLRVYARGRAGGTYETVFAFFVMGTVISLGVALLPIDGAEEIPDAKALEAGLGILLGMVGLNVFPGTVLTLWGAARLPAARVGLLLMGEVVVGVASAAALTDEPFGVRESLGSVLITGAVVAEVYRRQRTVRLTKGPLP